MKLGFVLFEIITVSPPSYLKNWKSANGLVVSDSSTVFCSVTLNCVYKVPAAKPVPPFAGSNLKIAVWLFACKGASTVEKLAEAELYSFTTLLDPLFGDVVLYQTEPLGLLSSDVDQVGLLAWLFCSKLTPL